MSQHNGPDGMQAIQTKLLSDTPSHEDALGCHQPIADTLSEMVLHDKPGMAVALTGSWGSGKSTVIRLSQKQLEQNRDPEVAVFIFDAWAHHGDPLRRTFLQELKDALAIKKWIEADEFNKEIGELTGRRSEREVASTTTLTTNGKILATAVLLVPLGCTLIPELSWPWKLLALLLAGGPLLSAILYYAHRWLTQGCRPAFDEVFSFFAEKDRVVTRTSTIRTPDTTSLEFEGLFASIGRRALAKAERRLVVVIDNLDRVSPDEARTIWTTMRTFFAPHEGQREAWIERFWLVVPFDKSAATTLWRKDHRANNQLGEEFVNKTFQVVVNVPVPILVSWQRFLIERLSEAFPQWDRHDQFELVQHIFAESKSDIGSQRSGHVTPRDMKLFVNRLVMLQRQWRHKIPLPLLALYLVKEPDFPHSLPSLNSNSFLSPQLLGLVGKLPWQKALAAIHFNVDPDDAIQVLIGEEVRKALESGDRQELGKFVEMPGFAHICVSIVGNGWNQWATSVQQAIPNVAVCLPDLRIPDTEKKRIWQFLVFACRRVRSWDKYGDNMEAGVKEILRNCQADELDRLVGCVLRSICEPPADPSGKEIVRTGADAQSWARAAVGLLVLIRTLANEQLIQDTFTIPGNADSCIEQLAALSRLEIEPALLPYLRPRESMRNVVDHLRKMGNEGKLTELHADAVCFMVQLKLEAPWQDLLSGCVDRLINHGIPTQEVEAVLSIALVIKKVMNITNQPHDFTSPTLQAAIASHLHDATKGPNDGARALCVLSLLFWNPKGQRDQRVGESDSGYTAYNDIVSRANSFPGVIQEVATRLPAMGNLSDVFRALEHPNGKGFIACVLSKSVENAAAPHQVRAETILERHLVLNELAASNLLAPKTLHTIVERACANDSLLDKAMSSGFDHGRAWLYTEMVACAGTPVPEMFRHFLVDGLHSVKKGTWVAQLKAPQSPLLALVSSVMNTGIRPLIGKEMKDALVEHAGQLVQDPSQKPKSASVFASLVDALADDYRSAFTTDITDNLLLGNDDVPLSSLLSVYGHCLGTADVSDDDADRLVRRAFPRIVQRAEATELTWVRDLVSDRPSILSRSRPASRTVLADAISARVKAGDLRSDSATVLGQIFEAVNNASGS